MIDAPACRSPLASTRPAPTGRLQATTVRTRACMMCWLGSFTWPATTSLTQGSHTPKHKVRLATKGNSEQHRSASAMGENWRCERDGSSRLERFAWKPLRAPYPLLLTGDVCSVPSWALRVRIVALNESPISSPGKHPWPPSLESSIHVLPLQACCYQYIPNVQYKIHRSRNSTAAIMPRPRPGPRCMVTMGVGDIRICSPQST